MKQRKYFLALFIVVGLTSCKKFVQVDPPINQVTSQTVFTSDATALAAVNGIYSQMMNNPNQFSCGLTTLLCGLCADEFYSYSPGTLDEFTQNRISFVNHSTLQSGFWQPAYNYIYTCNSVIEGLDKSTDVTPSVKSQLIGEAKFVRAFCYFYLVNLFGNVPLITASDYIANKNLPRAPVELVYQQITQDLLEAQRLLPLAFVNGERSKPTKWAATALLARTYLYLKDWPNAEAQATNVLSTNLFSLPGNLRSVFLKNSSEAIWQLQPVNTTYNTYEARTVLPTTAATLPTYVLTNSLVGAFEAGDPRKGAWDSMRIYNSNTLHLPYKYKVSLAGAPITEYYTVLRLAEVYLIRAEARAQQGLITDGLSDMNRIRLRASLPPLDATTSTELLALIERERRIELFAEWGHRWFDLKRTGRTNAVLGALKPMWTSPSALWPIPQGEINLNPQLTQNPGY